jgi:predicted amino acid-binding ACT domain protein
VRVHDVDEQAPGTERGEIWTVAVHGADRTGIVSAVTSALAEAGVSIHDLSTRLVGTGPPIYSMLLEVVVPDGVDPEAVADRLAAVATELEVALAMRPADADIL